MAWAVHGYARIRRDMCGWSVTPTCTRYGHAGLEGLLGVKGASYVVTCGHVHASGHHMLTAWGE